MNPGLEPRQTTSIVGKLKKFTMTQKMNGLDRYYYSLVIDYSKDEHEANMLMNLYKRKWTDGIKIPKFTDQTKKNEEALKDMSRFAKSYNSWIDTEMQKTPEEFEVYSVGRIDPKRHLKENCNDLIGDNVRQTFGMMMNSKALV